MPITSAAVEANGWVLALTLAASPGSFAAYSLSPDANPALTLGTTHPGFDLAGGVAVANAAKVRSLVATKPLRKPANPSNAGVLDARVIDETDLGGGSIRVRIALSNWVYATDAALNLTARAGWRTGEAVASIAVTNNSTVVCPAAISRWADVPYQLRRGPFDIEALAFGFAPQGTQPVAAVKYTVTDGVNTVTAWATALASSSHYGDNLRCHRVTIDPATAMPGPLTLGLLRVDRTVYPWIGPSWTTDPAGTRAMPASFATDCFNSAAQTPFAVAYDPSGAVYPFRTLYVDYLNGTTTAAQAMVGTGPSEAAALAAAKAVAPASRPKDVQTAVEAARLAKLQLPAANGQPQSTFGYGNVDGLRIVLAPQVHAGGLGSSAVGFAPQTLQTFLRVEGDPADTNPRANCVVNTVAAQSDFRGPDRIAFRNASIGLGYAFYLWCPYWHFDNVTMAGQPGFKTGGASPIGGSIAPSGKLGIHFTRTRIWQAAATMSSNFGAPHKLIRHCEWVQVALAATVCTSRLIGEAEDGFATGTAGTTQLGTPLQPADGDTGAVYDGIIAYNDVRAAKGRTWSGGQITVGGVSQRFRQVLFGNVMESIGSSSDALFSTGEQELANTREIIIEANTTVGARCNLLYNDASPAASVAATDSQPQNVVTNVRVAANLFASHFTKHDRFDDPAVKAQRVAAADPRNHGFRPYNTGAWAGLYGVGQRDNVNLYQDVLGPGAPDGFAHEFEGLNCRFDNAPIDPKYTNDQSKWRLSTSYPGATGLGDYTPIAGSPALGRVSSGNSDRNLAGSARVAPFAAGAFDGIVAVPIAVIAAAARSPMRAGTALLTTLVMVAPAKAGHATRASATVASPGSGIPALQLLPNHSLHILRDAFGLVLQPGGNDSGTVRTILVPADFRVHAITLS